MAASAIKHAVYFPKMYSWLSSSTEVVLTRDINKALMFNELTELEQVLAALGVKEAVVQKYKATLVIIDNVNWRSVQP